LFDEISDIMRRENYNRIQEEKMATVF